MRDIQCQDCGVTVVARSPTQRFCPSCSETRDLTRKRLWAQNRVLSSQQRERNATRMAHRKEHRRQAGLEANRESRSGMAWLDEAGPQLLWSTRIAIPFSYAASKNHIYTSRGHGHVALRREARAIRDDITLRIRIALKDRKVAHNKLWIDILVQKPNHRGDAVNVIDLVCDAIKDAVGIDDRWFSIRCLDWEIVKEGGRLIVGIGQETDINCRVCSYCGQIKPFSDFNKHAGNPLGIGRECRDCRRRGRRLRPTSNSSGMETEP
jgi:hypothetical protein